MKGGGPEEEGGGRKTIPRRQCDLEIQQHGLEIHRPATSQQGLPAPALPFLAARRRHVWNETGPALGKG